MAEDGQGQTLFSVNYYPDRIEFVIGEGESKKRVKFDPLDFKIVGRVSERQILDHAHSEHTNPHETGGGVAVVHELDQDALYLQVAKLGGRFLAYPRGGLRSKSGGMLFALALRDGRGGDVISEIEKTVSEYNSSLKEDSSVVDDGEKVEKKSGLEERVDDGKTVEIGPQKIRRPKVYRAGWDGSNLVFDELYSGGEKLTICPGEGERIGRFSFCPKPEKRVLDNEANILATWSGGRSHVLSGTYFMFRISDERLQGAEYRPEKIEETK